MKNTTINAAIVTLQKAQTDLQSQIDEALTNELALNKEIETLGNLPVSLDDFSQYLKKHIEFYANAWFNGRQPSHLLIARFRDETAMNKKGWKEFEPQVGEIKSSEFLMPHFCKLNQGDAFGALCFALPDVMHENLMTAYRAAIGDRWGNDDLPSVELRRASVTELRAKLTASRTQREELQTSLKELTSGVLGDSATTRDNAASVDPERSVGAFVSHMLKGQRMVNPDLVSSS
jgi:hypothetical protein